MIKRICSIIGLEDIKDYYWVNKKGVIISKYNGKRKEIKQLMDKDGYMVVGLQSIKGKKILMKVHRIVALAFVDNIENKPQVNHIDENKTNNHMDNLEWVTSIENNNHGTRTQRMIKSQSKAIVQYDLYGNIIKEFPSIAQARKETNTSIGDISKACKGKVKAILGFVFRYKGDPFDLYSIDGYVQLKNLPIYMCDMNDNILKEFECINDVYTYIDKKATGVIACCKGRQKSAYGYKWRYKD